ncbi:hypothetical protein CEE44_03495 [Candidatus Woesearchaeota archaeon B3_Woes]|nr:MAG: hypothetical protein CEE44_03495 [Candidatus Woesearchaeota archaeon B3_Woes]
MAYYGLENFLQALESWGLTDVLLPFLLFFTLIFAILQKTKILGEDKRNFNVVIALVMSLTVVIPHSTGSYPMNYDPINIVNAFLPGISLLIVAVVMLFILIGLWGGEAKWVGGSPSAMIAILAVVAVVWIFGAAARWWDGWGWFNNFFGSDTVSLIIIILVFGIIIWFITKSDKPSEGENIVQKFGDMFKKH